MKKRISILAALLCAVMTFCALSACEKIPEQEPESTTKLQYPLQFQFTAVANGPASENCVSVTPCEAYRKYFSGDTVNVYWEGLAKLNLLKDIEILIEVSHIEETAPLSVYASRVRLVPLPPVYDLVYDEDRSWGYMPFTIPDINDLHIPVDFPDFSEIPKEQLEDTSTYLFPVYRIVEVREDDIFLTTGNGMKAVLAISVSDASRLSCQRGDFITIAAKEVWRYRAESEWFFLIEQKQLTEFEVVSRSKAEELLRRAYTLDKPVIYLYPETPTVCSVQLELDGILTCTYPKYGANGWQNFTAMPDGTLIFPDGREYYCLYWEGRSDLTFDFSKGFCVKGSDTAEFLQDILPQIGLNSREANEFIIYWLPILQNSPYNIISFQQEAYTDAAKLNISPTPDSILRVFMAAYPVDSAVEMQPQEFDGFERIGFTVVEWGGSYAGSRVE